MLYKLNCACMHAYVHLILASEAATFKFMDIECVIASVVCIQVTLLLCVSH